MESTESVCLDILLYGVAFAAVYVVAFAASKHFFGLPRKDADVAFAADALVGCAYYPALVLLAVDACYRLSGASRRCDFSGRASRKR